MIPEIIKIDEVEYVRKDSISEQKQYDDYVLIRSKSAGVFFGHLSLAKNGGLTVMLKDCRRIWYWDGAASLSQMAVDGVSKPQNCKFPCAVPEITINEVIEIIPCTEKAVRSLRGVPIWKM